MGNLVASGIGRDRSDARRARRSVRAAQTVKVEPRRGSNDKAPWKKLDLTAITGQTIEKTHLFDVHLGETVVPYATLTPLKTLLPLKRKDDELPVDSGGTGGIHLGGLEQRMRGRWQQVSALWEQHKGANDKKTLLGRLDYHRELSAQLEWRKNDKGTPIRVVYTTSGQSTAAIIDASEAIVDHKLFWAPCRDLQEAHYVLAIINSRILYETAKPLMAKGTIRSSPFAKAPVEIVDTGIRCHEPLASGDSTGRSSSRQRGRPAIAKPLQATRRYGQHDRGSPRIARVARPIGRRQASRDAGKATISVIRLYFYSYNKACECRYLSS